MQEQVTKHDKWKFIILTFGCKVNQYETEAISEAWTKLGGIACTQPQAADIVCINSCAITLKGERDCRQAIYRILRTNPNVHLIITGCAATLCAEVVQQSNVPNIIIPQTAKYKLLRGPWACFADKQEETENNCTRSLYPPFAIATYNRARAVIKIQDGCTQCCTYCIVPSMRPFSTSRKPAEILSEARRLLHQGFQELILSGINLRQYHSESASGNDFWELVAYLDKELAQEFTNQTRIRLSSVEPAQLTARGLEVLATSKLICPHLHLSLQHASHQILKKMGRGHYTAQKLATAILEIQKFWPVFGLGCDIITGFPFEEAVDHTELIDFCNAMPFTYAHIFPYSPRPNTLAATYPCQVDNETKASRAFELRALFNKKNQLFRENIVSKNLTLHVVADTLTHNTTWHKGVCEYYVLCNFTATTPKLRAIQKAKPLRLSAKGLEVSILD